MKNILLAVLLAAAPAASLAEPAAPMGGKWISALSGQGNWRPAMRLAADFVVTNRVKRATLRATALGLYVPFVNGKEVTERRMLPGWTQYEHRVPSQTFDVTAHLAVGTNCLAALVGDGWYCGQVSYVGQPQGSAGWGRYPCFRAELTLECEDGSVTRLGTDRRTWRSFYGDPATLVNDIYQGEEYDALMDDVRWKLPGSKGGEVREASVGTEIVGDIGQPVVVTRTIRPASVERRPSGTYLLDFGENVAGVERIRLKKAHQGAVIVVRHGEDVDRAGNLWRANLAFAGAKTVLHCGATAPFEYAPRFTFYGFRYLEISGWPADEELTPESVTVEVLSSAVRETGTFECSNPLVNALFANVKRSQQANFIDVPTDCPQRCERFGWTGDAQVFAETAMMNYDVRRFFVKWLGDLRLCRSRSGAFPDIAPWPPQGFDTSAATGSAGWADAGVVCPWMLYRKYGDRAALREAYPSIVKYVDLISSARTLNTIGDHLNLDQKTSDAYIAEALRIEMLRLASLAAAALGEPEDVERLVQRRAGFLASFRARHFGADGLPKERTQTAAAFAIAYGLCRDEATKRAAGERLKELIAARGGHLATGFLGTPVLLRALTESGNLEAAYGLLETTTSPGWLYPVTQGATTVWERWDAKVGDRYNDSWMNSLNHYAYGSVAAWFYDTVAGIRDLTEEAPGDGSAGFRRFRLAPRPGGSLTYAKATHEIPGGGVISSGWKRKDGTVTWSFAVPEGTEAEIVPPGRPTGPLAGGGISDAGGRLVAKPGRYIVVCDETQAYRPAAEAEETDGAPADLPIDPMIGTEGEGSEYGGMMPMTGVPFGSMHLVPVTRTNEVGRTSFNALDKSLLGFCLTRQPAIWMGEFGPVRIWLDRPLPIESVDAHPWQTTVKAGGRTYELAATSHGALIRSDDPTLGATLADAGITTERTVRVSMRPIPNFACHWAKRREGNVLAVGVSLISAAKAAQHVPSAAKDGFASVVAASREAWDVFLDRVSVEAPEPVRRILYTGLYHALLYPRDLSEEGVCYSAVDDRVHRGPGYSCFSLWDTYRSEHPLLTLLAPERAGAMCQSLVDMYRWGGWLPVWPNPGYTGVMIGDPAAIVLAEAYVKGVKGFDAEQAFAACVKSADNPQPDDMERNWFDTGLDIPGCPETRGGLTWYLWNGYVAHDRTVESVSRTLDYALADASIAKFAAALGRKDEAARFAQRAKNYTNLWCAASKRFLPKTLAGEWVDPKTLTWENHAYTETDERSARWCVPHDVDGLVALMGGAETFERELDRFFEEDFFRTDAVGNSSVHGNETCHHVAYLYNRIGRYDKTCRRVRDILTRCYSDSRRGFDGNEDCGAMSAWYVLSALGFYPLDPASGVYELGTPLVDRAALDLGGNLLQIETKRSSADAWRVVRATFDGRELATRQIAHRDLVRGGKLVFELDNGKEQRK